MRCFYHHDHDAVGLCKHCSRALCPDCVAEVEGGLACKGRHEAIVEQVSLLVKRNANVQGRSPTLQLVQLAIYSLATILFGFLAVAMFLKGGRDAANGFLLLLPTGLMAVCAVSVLRWVTANRAKKDTP